MRIKTQPHDHLLFYILLYEGKVNGDPCWKGPIYPEMSCLSVTKVLILPTIEFLIQFAADFRIENVGPNFSP